MKLRTIKIGRTTAVAVTLLMAAPVLAQPTDQQYELVMRAVNSTLIEQTQKITIAIRTVPDETRKSSLGGLAAFAQLKKESVEAQRIRNVLAAAEKAKLLRQELPLAAIDLAISNSADRQSAAIAARNDLTMAQIATELAQLTSLQRGVPMIPNSPVAKRMPASQPNVELAPLPVVDRIYQPSPASQPIKVAPEPPIRGGGTVR